MPVEFLSPLLSTVHRLFTLLNERFVEYAYAGELEGLTRLAERGAGPLLLIMPQASLQKLPELHFSPQDRICAQGNYDGLQVEVFYSDFPFFAELVSDYLTFLVLEQQYIPALSVDGLLMLKLYLLPIIYRQENHSRLSRYEADIAELFTAYRPELAPILVELSRFLEKDDLQTLLEIVGAMQARLAAANRGPEQ